MTWLMRHDRGLWTPNLVFTPNLPGAGGYFYRPQKGELLVDGYHRDLRHGILLVRESKDEHDLANAIAHEWRHYWQWFNMEHKFPAMRFDMNAEYWSEIKRFFKNPRELDALVFSHKVAPCRTSEIWLEWINR